MLAVESSSVGTRDGAVSSRSAVTLAWLHGMLLLLNQSSQGLDYKFALLISSFQGRKPPAKPGWREFLLCHIGPKEASCCQTMGFESALVH